MNQWFLPDILRAPSSSDGETLDGEGNHRIDGTIGIEVRRTVSSV